MSLSAEEIKVKKLRWQCRRGMKEMDILFERYLDHYFFDDSEANKAAFFELIDEVDPVVMDYLTGRIVPENPAILTVLNKMQTPLTT